MQQRWPNNCFMHFNEFSRYLTVTDHLVKINNDNIFVYYYQKEQLQFTNIFRHQAGEKGACALNRAFSKSWGHGVQVK